MWTALGSAAGGLFSQHILPGVQKYSKQVLGDLGEWGKETLGDLASAGFKKAGKYVRENWNEKLGNQLADIGPTMEYKRPNPANELNKQGRSTEYDNHVYNAGTSQKPMDQNYNKNTNSYDHRMENTQMAIENQYKERNSGPSNKYYEKPNKKKKQHREYK